jgi:hypothetical protein
MGSSTPNAKSDTIVILPCGNPKVEHRNEPVAYAMLVNCLRAWLTSMAVHQLYTKALIIRLWHQYWGDLFCHFHVSPQFTV